MEKLVEMQLYIALPLRPGIFNPYSRNRKLFIETDHPVIPIHELNNVCYYNKLLHCVLPQHIIDQMAENLICHYCDYSAKLIWQSLSCTQDLSREFIEKYSDKLDLKQLSLNNYPRCHPD